MSDGLVITGKILSSTTTEVISEVAEQPLALVTVTEKPPVTPALIVRVVSPLLHR